MDYIIIVSCWLGALLAIVAAFSSALRRTQARIDHLEAQIARDADVMAGRMELLAAHSRGLDRRVREAKAVGREAAAAAGTALVEARAEVASLREAQTARMDAVQARIDGIAESIGIEPDEDIEEAAD